MGEPRQTSCRCNPRCQKSKEWPSSRVVGLTLGVALEPICGTAIDGPIDSRGGSLALGERMGAYWALGVALDAWRLYL